MCVYIYIYIYIYTYTRIADGNLYIYIIYIYIYYIYIIEAYPSKDFSVSPRYGSVRLQSLFLFLQSLNTEKKTHDWDQSWTLFFESVGVPEWYFSAIPDRPQLFRREPHAWFHDVGYPICQYVDCHGLVFCTLTLFLCKKASKCIKSSCHLAFNSAGDCG